MFVGIEELKKLFSEIDSLRVMGLEGKITTQASPNADGEVEIKNLLELKLVYTPKGQAPDNLRRNFKEELAEKVRKNRAENERRQREQEKEKKITELTAEIDRLKKATAEVTSV